MISKLLLAIDGSDTSGRAIEVAAELARKLDAGLVIVHVLMHGRPPRELMRMAEIENLVKSADLSPPPASGRTPGDRYSGMLGGSDAAQNARAIAAIGEQLVASAQTQCGVLGVKNVTTVVRNGETADEILDVAAELAVDMIVIGSRGLGTLRGAVLGSVSQKVLHHAEGCVLTVH